ncbi:MAG: DUF2079 domain-containing protein [Candidatus Rokuibacteriota bacterium]
MRVLARSVEAAAAAVACLAVAVLATGGWTVGGFSLTRPEDLVVLLVGLAALRLLQAPVALPAARPARVVAVGVALYALLMGFIVVTRHLAFRTHALDLGYYVQVVWSIASGYGAYVTLPAMHAWGDHFSPVLYLLTPLGWLAPGGTGLVIVQTLVFAAGGVFVYGYATRRLAPRANAGRLAAGFALLYLVNPSLHGINIRDIHPQAFAIPLLIAAALAFDTRRYVWCAAALALTLGGREDCAIAVVGFAVWLALARGRWLAAALLGALSIAVLFADLAWLMPHFRGSPYPHLHRYQHLGSSLTEILMSLPLRPWRWIVVLVTAEKLVYLVTMLAPLGFLPLLAPRALAAALPGLAMNLLSLDPVLMNYRAQYQSFVLPFLVLAAIDGYARLRSWQGRGDASVGHPHVAPRRPVPAGALLAFAFLASVALTARTVNDLALPRWRPTEEHRAVRGLMSRIPPEAAVSTTERLVAQLAARREIHIFPVGAERSEYVLEREAVIARASLPDHALAARAGGWVLLKRRG